MKQEKEFTVIGRAMATVANDQWKQSEHPDSSGSWGSPYSAKAISWVMREAVKTAGIDKMLLFIPFVIRMLPI